MAYVSVDIDLDDIDFSELVSELRYRFNKGRLSPDQVKEIGKIISAKDILSNSLENILLNEVIEDARKRLSVFEIERRLA